MMTNLCARVHVYAEEGRRCVTGIELHLDDVLNLEVHVTAPLARVTRGHDQIVAVCMTVTDETVDSYDSCIVCNLYTL